MAGLGQYADSDALEHKYLGKFIFYVEGQTDAGFFRHCVATGNDEHLEFKSLPEITGSSAAIARAREERNSNNPLVFALVDGEMAVERPGGFQRFLECDETVFQLDEEGYEGVVFLAQHEMENIVLQHADLCAHILDDVSFATLGSRDRATVESTIAMVLERQFNGALCKYAMVHLVHRNRTGKVLAKVYWGDETIDEDHLRERVTAAKFVWDEFTAERSVVHSAVQQRLDGLPDITRTYHRNRIVDGKTALAYLEHTFGIAKNWHGHLIKQMSDTPYFTRLRDEILQIARATSL